MNMNIYCECMNCRPELPPRPDLVQVWFFKCGLNPGPTTIFVYITKLVSGPGPVGKSATDPNYYNLIIYSLLQNFSPAFITETMLN